MSSNVIGEMLTNQVLAYSSIVLPFTDHGLRFKLTVLVFFLFLLAEHHMSLILLLLLRSGDTLLLLLQ